MRPLAYLIPLLALSGCVSTPGNNGQPADAPPAAFREQAKSALIASLKDPGSAQGVTASKLFNTTNQYPQYTYHWASCVSVNAKNSYGGYTGMKYHVVFFRGGKPIHVSAGGSFDAQDCQDMR